MIELLSGRLCNVTVDGGVSGRLFCTIGLHHLTGNFLLTAENRGRCSVLAVNDRKLTTLNRCYYDGSELRPIEIFGDLIDVGCAPPTDFALIGHIDHELVGFNPFQKRGRAWRKFGCGGAKTLRAERYEHRVLLV